MVSQEIFSKLGVHGDVQKVEERDILFSRVEIFGDGVEGRDSREKHLQNTDILSSRTKNKYSLEMVHEERGGGAKKIYSL